MGPQADSRRTRTPEETRFEAFLRTRKLKLTRENQPDGIICRFNQLLDIFPQAPDINLSAMEQRSVE